MGCGTSAAAYVNKTPLSEKPVRGVPAADVVQGSPVAVTKADAAETMALVELLGEQLLTKRGLKPTAEVLGGKSAVGIYFSAHWCPPCRGFTPQLADMYSKVLSSKGMEIVFASSDKDGSSFKKYYAEMPWVAIPYEKRELKEKLSKKYKVQGIPSLVVLGPDGKTITTEGREAVSNDPSGKAYPWIPPTAAEKAKTALDTLGADLINKTQGKPIGLYFSAHWCPPCRGFTPKLAEFYKDGLKDKMEIIFVSSDKDQASFNEYFGEMPWLAMPFEKRAEKATLSDAFGVNGIPSFVVINPDGTLITVDGRSKVTADPKGENFPTGWLPQPFNDLNDDPSDLNAEACLIAIGADEAMCEALKIVADESYNMAGKDVSAMPLRFFKGPDGGVVQQVRNLTGLREGATLVLIDIPDDGGFYLCEKDASTAEGVRQFIADYNAKRLQRKQLQK